MMITKAIIVIILMFLLLIYLPRYHMLIHIIFLGNLHFILQNIK